MAQTGYTPLQIYSSSTGGNAPSAGNLANSTLGSELAINITDGKLFYKDNAGVVQVIAWKTTPTTAGGTGLTSYAAGDLLYYATGTALSKLAIGASTNILTSSGSAPQWTAPSTITVGKATNLDGGAAGSVPYQSGAGATTFLGIGAANTVLTSSGSAPQWSTSLSLAGNVGAASHTVSTTQNIVTGGMWYQTSGGLLVMSPATTGGFAWNNYANNAQIASLSNDGALTIKNNFLLDGAGNPTHTVKTSGAGNNPLYRLQADTNYWDMIGVFSNATDDLRFRYNNNDFLTIFNTGGVSIGDTTDPGAGNLRLGTGNLIIGTSGKGIDFSATPGTGTSELLDDYEEGTWTPVPSRQTGGAITYTNDNRTGKYTRIGNLVTVSAIINITGVTSQGSGETRLAGLPYAPADNSLGAGVLARNTAFTTSVIISCFGWTDSELRFLDNTNTSTPVSVDWKTGIVNLTFSYFV